MECEDSIPIPPAIPDELLRKIFSFVSHDNRSEVERVNSQFYEVMCESQRKNTGLRIEYGYLQSPDLVNSLMNSSRCFSSVTLTTFDYKEKQAEAETSLQNILEKFGPEIEAARLFSHASATNPKFLYVVFSNLANIKRLSLFNIRLQESKKVPSIGLQFLGRLEDLTVIHCEDRNGTLYKALEEIPAGVIKKLNLEDFSGHLAGLIAKQGNVVDISINSTSDRSKFPRGVFDHMKLKSFELSLDRTDNQGNYANMGHFLEHQPGLCSLNLMKTRIGGDVFAKIVDLQYLEHLTMNIAFIPMDQFRKIAIILKQLKTLKLYNEIGMRMVNFLALETLSTQWQPMLSELKLHLGDISSDGAHLEVFKNIGKNCPNMKILDVQASWSFELLHVVFKNYKQLTVLKAIKVSNDMEYDYNSERSG